MTAPAINFWETIDTKGGSQAISQRDTPFGFVFSQKCGRFCIGAIAETMMKALALITMVAASLLWFVPVSEFALGIVGRSLITAICMFVGYAIYRYANRGFRVEFEIDKARREIRIATRNSSDMPTVRRTIPLRNVESGFIRRPAKRGARSLLSLRIAGNSDPLTLVSAPEAELVPILERLMEIARLQTPERIRAA